ncbi:hypothetical protein EV175_001603 [Coemansia sp. RSA 1933]|nr:hypothetical protein EV175_001603 [Coemansia sp. RSA 1933]
MFLVQDATLAKMAQAARHSHPNCYCLIIKICYAVNLYIARKLWFNNFHKFQCQHQYQHWWWLGILVAIWSFYIIKVQPKPKPKPKSNIRINPPFFEQYHQQ